MSRVNFGREIESQEPVTDYEDHAHRMAVAMAWGVALSLLMWGGVLMLVF